MRAAAVIQYVPLAGQTSPEPAPRLRTDLITTAPDADDDRAVLDEERSLNEESLIDNGRVAA